VTKLSFFIGKGGVGKTTVSAAYAVHQALRHKNDSVLLLSSDPAHSLADIFEQRLGDKPKPIRLPGGHKLHALQVDAEKRFRAFVEQHKQEMLSIIESGSIFSRRDVEPLLNATLPGMAEMSAVLAIHDALQSGRYDHIVVDTAPFGHTLRLFSLPEQFLRFVDFLELAASRDRVLAAHFGGTGRMVGGELIAQWRVMGDDLAQSIGQDAALFLVTTPEKFALNESLRVIAELHERSPGMKITSVVLNRAVLRPGACKVCRKRAAATRTASALLRREFRGRELRIGEDSGAPIIGIAGLQTFANHVFAGKRLAWSPTPPKMSDIKLKRVKWPGVRNPLTMVLGKGGVGKTTISAGLGFVTRRQTDAAVEICSVDPAPSLDDVFQTKVDDEPRPVLGDKKFRASEMDSVAMFRDWAQGMKDLVDRATTSERSSVHVDLWFERQLFVRLLDSVPPGLDEILGVFRIFDLLGAKSRRVIIDMAPTGHALELLQTPERMLIWTRLLLKTLAAHRTLAVVQDAGLKIAQLGQRTRELVKVLKQPQQTRIHTVVLPEFLPDRETERLLSQLRSLGLASKSMFVNRVLFREDAGSCRRCQRAIRWQAVTLSRFLQRYRAYQIFVVRNFPTEIAGKKLLQSFTGELWQLA